jgi:PBP1b-binding outer membrane lipoprotein LpoB
MHRSLSFLAVAVLLGGCAAETSTEEARVEKQYRTGSHIPGRAPASDVTSVSGDELEKGRNGSLSPGPSMPMPRGGGS